MTKGYLEKTSPKDFREQIRLAGDEIDHYHQDQLAYDGALIASKLKIEENLRSRSYAWFEVKGKLLPYIGWFRDLPDEFEKTPEKL